MNNSFQHEPEIEDPTHEPSLRAVPNGETNEEPSWSINTHDTMVSIVVLLLACLWLTALAHVFVQ